VPCCRLPVFPGQQGTGVGGAGAGVGGLGCRSCGSTAAVGVGTSCTTHVPLLAVACVPLVSLVPLMSPVQLPVYLGIGALVPGTGVAVALAGVGFAGSCQPNGYCFWRPVHSCWGLGTLLPCQFEIPTPSNGGHHGSIRNNEGR
jgi:hypothetical protein